MATNGWSRRFDAPIPLPAGGELATLREAGEYIAGPVRRRTAQAALAHGHRDAAVGRRAWRHRHAGGHRDAESASA
jgi:hypothetical protein